MKVYELLAKPEVWTKGAYARNKEDMPVGTTAKDACKFCLYGALLKCYSNDTSKRLDIMNILADKHGISSIVLWNDSEETTHDKVVKLAKDLDI